MLRTFCSATVKLNYFNPKVIDGYIGKKHAWVQYSKFSKILYSRSKVTYLSGIVFKQRFFHPIHFFFRKSYWNVSSAFLDSTVLPTVFYTLMICGFSLISFIIKIFQLSLFLIKYFKAKNTASNSCSTPYTSPKLMQDWNFYVLKNI